MTKKRWRALVLTTLGLVLLSLTVQKNSVCCMFASVRAYGFPGEFLTLSRETESLAEAEKIYTLTSRELFKTGWQLNFAGTIESKISTSAFFNLFFDLLFWFAVSLFSFWIGDIFTSKYLPKDKKSELSGNTKLEQ